jgi:hypothetical protein
MFAFVPALIVATIFASRNATVEFSLPEVQQHSILREARVAPGSFDTASEAAYAAAIAYRMELSPDVEIGAKIYVDLVSGQARYTYGRVIDGTVDNTTGDAEISFNPTESDDHFALVGVWHRHPAGSDESTLLAHNDQVEETHLAIWTSINRKFYVQYWDGSRVIPRMETASTSVAPLCTHCT